MFIVPVQKRSKTQNVDSAKPKAEYRTRPLNADDVRKMPSDELRWHELNNRQALEAALKSESARSPQQREDDRVTDSTSGASKEAGERRGWDATKVLTYDDIGKMTADESLWQSCFNRSWRAAFDEEDRRRQSKKHVAKTNMELCWNGHATEEEDEAARRAGYEFVSRTLAFPKTVEAVNLMIDYMKQNLMDATRMGSYTKAFRALVEQGRIKPLIDNETANEYLRKHPELHGGADGKPLSVPLIFQNTKAEATKSAFQRAEAATARAGSTAVTDYPQERRGVPPLNDIEKASLRQKVRSMSADELAEKCSTDPSFKKALDSLES